DRHLAVQIVAVALEHRMRLDVDLDVQIARRPAVDAGLAVAGRADPHPVVDARRDLHFERLGFLHLARPVAVHARFRDVGAGAVALRTGLLDAEETLRHAHRALAVTGRAGFRLRAGLRARAVTDFARHPARHA